MKVLVNALSSKAGGGTTYLRNFIRFISSTDTGVEFTVLLSSVYHKELIESASHNVNIWKLRMPRPALFRIVWEQLCCPLLLRNCDYDVVFNLCEIAPLNTRIKTIVLVRNQNIFSDTHKGEGRMSYKAIRLKAQQVLARLSIQRAAWRIFPSQAMKDIVARAVHQNLDGKSSVVHYGISRDFLDINGREENNNNREKTRYLLYVSNFAEHKNLNTLIEALNIVKSRKDGVKLLLVGKMPKEIRGERESSRKKSLKKKMLSYNINEDVVFAGHIGNQMLPAIYRKAELFVFPSLKESFGHPIVEAMASGLPIAISDLPYAHEICGDAAIYFNPLDHEDMADKIIRVLDDDNLKLAMKQKSRIRAGHFDWDKCFSEVIDIINNVGKKLIS